MTKVKDVMTKTVINIESNRTVIEAVALMAENDVGNLIVMDDNIPIGIVTERDFVRRVLAKCYATIGQLGKADWKLVKLGKAGRAFHMGKRPTTRGKARSDGHPLGGSYSRRLGRQPVDKWGNISKGGKTRSRKSTDKYIVKSRRVK